MSQKQITFVLAGVHAGKTMAVNGHEFYDGRYTYQGSDNQIASLTNVFEFYGAYPEGKVPEAEVQTPVVGSPDLTKADDAEKATLGEAIGQLDPDNDAHWTSNNLPALDVLETLTGTKVSRADVNTLAEDFTRAKARAVKAMA